MGFLQSDSRGHHGAVRDGAHRLGNLAEWVCNDRRLNYSIQMCILFALVIQQTALCSGWLRCHFGNIIV